jgi:hypothetical protein
MSDVATVRVAPERLGALRDEAAKAEAPLLWLLGVDARPEPDALEPLIRHAPQPAASLPVDPGGRAVLALMGRVPERDAPEILAAIERRCLPLRHTHVVSLLVERELILATAPPQPDRFGWYAGCEWTARLFAQQTGLLVPGSRVTVAEAPAGSPLHVLRVARAAGWRKGETVRELHRALTPRGR